MAEVKSRLTLLAKRVLYNKHRDSFDLYQCDCGNVKFIISYNVKSGNTTSCGCYFTEQLVDLNRELKKTHGQSGTRTYRIWKGMHGRCKHPKTNGYKNYGGRGIKVCKRWSSFENFLEDMGECPDGFSIDRIDVNGNYEPANCRWILLKDQAKNRRNTRATNI